MIGEPAVVERGEEPYVAKVALVTMQTIGTVLPSLWDVTGTPDGDRWAARLEIYRDDDEPDMGKWEIELAFKLAGD
jgi:hypothetical protein